ncbi:molybdenum cofactor guanylyltransferase [Desulfurivibrio alkaliphilus]|uniref:Probable molybdenum cofactor guanylyltransferase n=1 Tax=Desulfurivibrio alkaliphilus (strain DSM 19089 / UNIQEM U267 / AHT2) TaxID=589865 RepID=D6Z520_DESAT|nr:molybdenum cofactor guanylyltransferase [Desulfurivibrio alkaliphilus]ADH86645.1 formate dehydrogenase accessory protein FdhD [Desulfurivibrio alkaliphilus AHT 2]
MTTAAIMPTEAAAGDFTEATAGVILAGGKSSRFGSNKALAHYRGRPLVARVAAVLEEIFSERLLVTNTPADYAFLGWPMTGDLVLNAGPLGGIQAALRRIDAPRAFVVACDMPHLNGAVIRRLCRCPGDWDVILPAPTTGPEPLHAVYHRRILPAVEAALARGEGKLSLLLQELRVRRMTAAELGLAAASDPAFTNINYREDL